MWERDEGRMWKRDEECGKEEKEEGIGPIKKISALNQPSNLLRPRLLLCRALAHDGRLEASPKIVGQLVQFLVAVDLDRLARRVADHVAVVAPREMIIELGFG